MELWGSSPYSQQPAICPYPKPDPSSLRVPLSNLLKIQFNIILQYPLSFPSGLLP
jgi:hypothetical protein